MTRLLVPLLVLLAACGGNSNSCLPAPSPLPAACPAAIDPATVMDCIVPTGIICRDKVGGCLHCNATTTDFVDGCAFSTVHYCVHDCSKC